MIPLDTRDQYISTPVWDRSQLGPWVNSGLVYEIDLIDRDHSEFHGLIKFLMPALTHIQSKACDLYGQLSHKYEEPGAMLRACTSTHSYSGLRKPVEILWPCRHLKPQHLAPP